MTDELIQPAMATWAAKDLFAGPVAGIRLTGRSSDGRMSVCVRPAAAGYFISLCPDYEKLLGSIGGDFVGETKVSPAVETIC
jgi:hypothetical protein